MVWESRALRLLTIFFCGTTIVTPTFFRSLVYEREGERGKGRRGRKPDTIRERDVTEEKMGRKKDGKCALVIKNVTPM